jgi:YjbE family integral membrane protein
MNPALNTTEFWLALVEIIWVNILLSGDNAVVIALAARNLPGTRQRRAIVVGTVAAIAFRIVLTLAAATLLALPWLKAVGAVLLLYIGVGLLAPAQAAQARPSPGGGMWTAVRIIVIADLVMSLDNVVAVAAAAHGSIVLLVIGLVLSIPLVVFGSTLLLKVIERAPVVVWAGGALLGFIAGDMLVHDRALAGVAGAMARGTGSSVDRLALFSGVAGAVLVVIVGKMRRARRS